MYNAKGIHQFRIHKMPIQFCDKHVKNYKTLDLHLCNGCEENILAHWWINSNNTLKMRTWYEWLVMQNVKVSTPMLRLVNQSLVNMLAKLLSTTSHFFLKVFKLVSNHWIIIHHEEISLTYFNNYHKITNETSFHLANFIKALATSNNGSK
jgi:hypothetical protein